MTAREKLYNFLEARPSGATAMELTSLLFSGCGSDSEFASRFIDRMLGGDPNFAAEAASGVWRLAAAEPLRIQLTEAEYVVVDLETTGGRPGPGAIIEVGAYRMRGQRLIDSFQSLVRPGSVIPRFITRLTSINNEMVATAPSIERVLTAFRSFLGDAVMVAHNAAFDFAFLDFEFRRLFGIGLRNPVLCTLRLARRLLPSLRRRGLDSLAEHFGLSTQGRHRGLGDARMAAEVLSIFIDSASKLGIGRLDLLLDWQHQGAGRRRIERHIPPEVIAALPQSPGVYLMRNERGELLYVGKARRLRSRVASYFNGGLGRKAKVLDLVAHLHAVETRVTRSSLEAALLEARLIREHKPPYNRALRSAPPAWFVRVDLMDPFPRLTLSRKLSARRGILQLGPFVGRQGLDRAVRALARRFGLRTCVGRLVPAPDRSPCIYGQIGHCAAPCNERIGADAYAERVRQVISFLRGRAAPVMGALVQARELAARAMRFEEAARAQREIESVRRLAIRNDRLSQAVVENNLLIVTGRPEEDTPAVHVVLSGRLALSRELDSSAAAEEVSGFVTANYECYRARPVAREELEPMATVARWLRERAPDEGRLIYLNGPALDPQLLRAAMPAAPIAQTAT